MHHTYSHLLFRHFKGKYHFRFAYISITFILVIIVLSANSINLLMFMLPTYSKASSDSVSDFINVKTITNNYTIIQPHDRLTCAAPIKQGIIYNDSFKETGINYYYINNPATKNTLYIKYLTGNISPNDIQIFDTTNRELNIKLFKKSTYLYIPMEKIVSKMSDNSRIYFAIVGKKNIKFQIIYNNTTIKKTTAKKKSQKKSVTITNNKTPSTKKITHHNLHKNKTNNKNNIIKKNTTKNNTIKNNTIKNNTIKNNTIKNNTIKKQENKFSKQNNIHKKNISKKNKNKTDLFFISLSHKFISLNKRECIKLKYNIKPATIKQIKTLWSSSNNNIVSVSNGKVTTHQSGIAVIKLTVKHNTTTKNTICTIRVKDN